MRRLNKEVSRILHRLGNAINEDSILAAEAKARHNSADNEKKARKRADDGMRALVDHTDFSQSDLKAIYGQNTSPKIIEVQKSAADAVAGISAEMADSIQHGIIAYCDEKRNKLEEALQDTQAQIREEVEKIDQELEQEKDVQSMFRAFELPEVPAALEFPTAASEKLKDTFDSGQLRRIAATKRWEYQVERNAKGFVESVCSFLGMKYYETRERYDVEGFKADLANVMSENAQKALSEVSEGALASQIRELTSFVGQLYEQRQQYEGDYQQIFTSYLEMLNLVLGVLSG